MYLKLNDFISILLDAFKFGQSVKIKAHGTSMLPFIMTGNSLVLQQVNKLKKGDILLCRVSNQYFVIHRLVRIKKEHYWVRGDANRFPEGPFSKDCIYAKVIYVCNKYFSYSPENGIGLVLGLVWLAFYPLSIKMLHGLIYFKRKYKQLSLRH